MGNSGIDAVITWVDGNDPVWLSEKEKYLPKRDTYKSGTSNMRFRDWENLQYIFRGIELYMPWIDTVHFITCGHLPEWLNTEAEKLHIVKHSDFIPEAYLPTFNSDAIELNMHRIPGLSEKFINFNDDMFVINPTTSADFFRGDVPCETGILTPFVITPNGIAATEMNNLEIINKYFSMNDVKKNKSKWINPKYGLGNLRTMIFMQWRGINGIYEPHIPLSLKKSTLEMLWNIESEAFITTSSNRFREKNDINIWLVHQWHLLSGNFVPRRKDFGIYCSLPNDMDSALSILKSPGKHKMICINDSLLVDDFESVKNQINTALTAMFPKKSSFEK